MSQVVKESCVTSLPKKKAAITKKSYAQSNKLTNYFMSASHDSDCPPSTITKHTLVMPYPVFNTAPADCIGAFSIPMPNLIGCCLICIFLFLKFDEKMRR